MSDNEEEYSVASEGESENYKQPNFIKNKKTSGKPTISDYDNDDDTESSSSDSDSESVTSNEDENNDIKIDGVDDNVDEDIYEEDDEVPDDDEDDDEDEDDEIDKDDEENDDETYTKTKKGGASKKSKENKTQATIQIDGSGLDYDDDEDYQDENYLQKFDKEITKNYIMDFHPECLNHNFDEIKALSNVTRDEFNIIIDPLHKTIPFLTKYEKTRILGQRSKQIECGAKPLVKVPENIIDAYLIAELELEQKAIPFIIRRPIPSGGSEYWNLKDLEMISF